MDAKELLAHVVEVAYALEDAAFAYEQAVLSGTNVAEAQAVLDKARSANGTARFLAKAVK